MLNLPEKLSDEEINEMLRTADKVQLSDSKNKLRLKIYSFI